MLIDNLFKAAQSFMMKKNRGLIDPSSFNNAIWYVTTKITKDLTDELARVRNRVKTGRLDVNFYDKVENIKSALTKLYKTHNLILDPVANVFLYPDDFSTEDVIIYKNKPVGKADITAYLDRVNIGLLSNSDSEFMIYIKDQEGLITVPMLTASDIATDPLEMFYFKNPIPPVWAYVPNTNPPQFDPTTSVDVYLSEEYFAEMLRESLIYLGAEIKDFPTVQIFQSEDAKSAKESNNII